MAYATISDIETRYRTLSESEKTIAEALLDDAAVMIDKIASEGATDGQKKVVSCRMVIRALPQEGMPGMTAPIGATQGSMTALGYTESWTISNGAANELYFSKEDKKLLGVSNQIGSYSPLEE